MQFFITGLTAISKMCSISSFAQKEFVSYFVSCKFGFIYFRKHVSTLILREEMNNYHIRKKVKKQNDNIIEITQNSEYMNNIYKKNTAKMVLFSGKV